MFLYTIVIVTTLTNGEVVRAEQAAGAMSYEQCEETARDIASQRPSAVAYCYISGQIEGDADAR